MQKTYKNIKMENSIDGIDDSNIQDILTELIDHKSPTQSLQQCHLNLLSRMLLNALNW